MPTKPEITNFLKEIMSTDTSRPQTTTARQSIEEKYPRRPTPEQIAKVVQDLLTEDKKTKKDSRPWRRSAKGKKSKSSGTPKQPKSKYKVQLRPSLYDYVRIDLQMKNLSVCYNQRVYIVGKNIPMAIPSVAALSTRTEVEDSTMRFANTLTPTAKEPETFYRKSLLEGFLSDGSDMGKTTITETYSVKVDEEVDEEECAPEEDSESETGSQWTSVHAFKQKIMLLKSRSEQAYGGTDALGGLFLYMDEYSIMVVEGVEHIVTEFLKEFQRDCMYEYWTTSRVFAIEDTVEKAHFIPSFYIFRMNSFYMSEKLPPSTPNDINLMREQHRKVYLKMHSFVEFLSKEDTPYKRFLLPSAYNRMVPETQRLDMVVKSTRFYHTLEEYLDYFKMLVSRPDDIAMVWPEPYNYLSLDVFRSTEFDTNLTFPAYFDSEERKKRSSKMEVAASVADSSSESQLVVEAEWENLHPEEEVSEAGGGVLEAVTGLSEETAPTAPSEDSVESFYANPLKGIENIELKATAVAMNSKKKAGIRASQSLHRAIVRSLHRDGERPDEDYSHVTPYQSELIKNMRGYASRILRRAPPPTNDDSTNAETRNKS